MRRRVFWIALPLVVAAVAAGAVAAIPNSTPGSGKPTKDEGPAQLHRANILARLDVPQAYGPVRRTGEDTPAVRGKHRAFDRPRVLRVLARNIADLDEPAGYPAIADEEPAEVDDPEARRARHWRRLAGPTLRRSG